MYFIALVGIFVLSAMLFSLLSCIPLPLKSHLLIFFDPKCYNRSDSLEKNQDMEFERNKERFTFLKVITS